MLACTVQRLYSVNLLTVRRTPCLEIGVNGPDVPLEFQALTNPQEVEVRDKVCSHLIHLSLIWVLLVLHTVVVGEDCTSKLKHGVTIGLKSLIALS